MYFVSFSLQKYLHAVDGIDANLQAHPQEPPEVYLNLLPPSVGETTGGIHPHAVRHKYLCPTGGKHPKSTAGKHLHEHL